MKKQSLRIGAMICATTFAFMACEKDLSNAGASGTNGVQNPNPDAVVVDDMDREGTSASSDGIIPNQYIVTLKESSINLPSLGLLDYKGITERAFNQINGLLAAAGLGDIELKNVYSQVFSGFAAVLSDEQVERLKALPIVDRVEPDQLITVEGELVRINSKGGDQFTKAQNVPYGINRVGTASGAGKRAFVLDTGIDSDHEDLNVNTSLSKGFVGGTTGSCGLLSFLFGCSPSTEPDFEDRQGHGTHVAGTIAAIDNGRGVIGVAAGAEVVAIKVLGDNGSGSTSGIIQGLDYVANVGRPGDAANLSLGGGRSTSLDNACINLGSTGVYVTLAAGNESQNANNVSPARANGQNVFTISAMDSQDRYASYSNFANPPIDFCMPGSGVLSTFHNNRYATLSGTSMAAPHMAGILLITNGNPSTDGTVRNDPDGNPDPIAVK